MAKDIQWEQIDDRQIKVSPAHTGCSVIIGFALAILGALIILSPVLELITTEPGINASTLKSALPSLLFSLVLGLLLTLAGASLAFSERYIIVDGHQGEVSLVRSFLFFHRTRNYPATEFQAAGVRDHGATKAAGASPRIADFTHDVLLYRHAGEPLYIDHARWENPGEAQALAAVLAQLLDLELLGQDTSTAPE